MRFVQAARDELYADGMKVGGDVLGARTWRKPAERNQCLLGGCGLSLLRQGGDCSLVAVQANTEQYRQCLASYSTCARREFLSKACLDWAVFCDVLETLEVKTGLTVEETEHAAAEGEASGSMMEELLSEELLSSEVTLGDRLETLRLD